MAEADQRPVRLWPGVTLGAALLLVRFGIPPVAPGFEGFRIAFMGGFLGSLAIALWWAFLSRAPWVERLGAIVLIVGVLAATLRVNHESMGLMWCLGYGIPVVHLALVAWAAGGRGMAVGPRRAALFVTIVLASGLWTLVRLDGLTGAHAFQFAWRWTATPEHRLLSQTSGDTSNPRSGTRPVADRTGWPGFRGPRRDGTAAGVRIDTDWSHAPPVELWRRPVGPGWSSFAVGGGLFYTQEQRGEDEVVACHSVMTGAQVWMHRNTARFFEAMGGPGPRATPTLHDGRVFAFGATGLLNALDAKDGTVHWSRNVDADAGVRAPVWGFSSSPLVVDDLVMVAASGTLVAYDRRTGDPRWVGTDGGHSYSSPTFMTIAGVGQIVMLTGAGAIGVSPADGTELWRNPWKGPPIVQPSQVADGDVLTSAGEGRGIRRLRIALGAGGWSVDERWTTERLKPNFNDFVVQQGHVYGFDGNSLACVGLDDGERRWKGGDYGQGQLVLLPDQDVLLVLSEAGDLILVTATPDVFSELARYPAITGKTWNHPALVGDVLLVRNGQEMAAFRLSREPPD